MAPNAWSQALLKDYKELIQGCHMPLQSTMVSALALDRLFLMSQRFFLCRW